MEKAVCSVPVRASLRVTGHEPRTTTWERRWAGMGLTRRHKATKKSPNPDLCGSVALCESSAPDPQPPAGVCRVGPPTWYSERQIVRSRSVDKCLSRKELRKKGEKMDLTPSRSREETARRRRRVGSQPTRPPRPCFTTKVTTSTNQKSIYPQITPIRAD
jgi:hypothetical protein